MKKLMVALAAIALGVSAQAASVEWNFNKGFSDGYGDPIQGTLAFFVGGTEVSGSPLVVDGPTTGTIKGDDGVEWIARLTITNFEEGGSWYKDYAFTMDAANHPGYSTTADYLTGLGGTVASKLTLEGDLWLDESAAGQGFTAAVPEPTSGLLLLLGVAGLALRRRRA